MKLKQIGEFGLIQRIVGKKWGLSPKGTVPKGDVVVGIGDDCAVLKWKKDKLLLVTCDMLIEGVHFSSKKASPLQIGHKALGCSLSDTAAMAGVPKWAVVSIGLPKKWSVKDADDIFKGIKALAKRFKVNIIGGDTTASDKLIIDVTVLGEVGSKRLALRSGARPGDVIFVTGNLGGSGRGKHLKFTPRINEARLLSRNFKITSMIDISDGLSSDLWQIARASKVGARIYQDRIPVSKDSQGIKGALNDGEDFELLFTIPKNQASRLSKFKSGINITEIGEIVARSKGLSIVGKKSRSRRLLPKGFTHF